MRKKSNLFLSIFMLSIIFLLSEVQAVRTNGIDSDEEYVNLGKRKEFEAVGHIVTHNKETVTFSTGTLINKNTVLTAAHCFKELVEEAITKKLLVEGKTSDGEDFLEPVTFSLNNTYICFDQRITFHTEEECNKNPSYYRVKSVTLNPYFIQDKITYGAYVAANDTAFLVLEKEPTDITPLPLLQFTLGNPGSGFFVGYGKGEPRNAYSKRGALQLINEGSDCFNALYFQPLEEGKMMRGYSRKVQDTNNGNALWHHTKLPYGIGEHGDSGGPLITYVQEYDKKVPYVIGVVSGGSLADSNPDSKVNYVENPEISDNEPPASMYGKYKSVFARTVFSVLNSIQMSAAVEYMLKKANSSS